MIKIEFPQLLEVEPFTFNQRGQQKTLHKQFAYAYVMSKEGKPQPHPVRISVILEDPQRPYAPGNYTLLPHSIYVDRYGSLSLSPKLAPVRA